MNKQTRIQQIKKILESENSIGKIEIPWKDQLESMDVYKVPLECLIYNKFNGRILSRTKSLEKQNMEIDAESEDGKQAIGELLWRSHPDRNQTTLKTLLQPGGGQQKPGIITKDGIIIDGNRRAMLLDKSEKFDYFKAVILPVTLDDDPLEIEKLETTYQMGEDEKLSYNPTEKYLKAKGLYLKLANKKYRIDDIDEEAIRKICEWMNEEKSTVTQYLQVMNTMDDYLKYLGYEGIYTQLDGREDQSIQLTRWLNAFYGENSLKAFEGYRDEDVDDLKTISFDYLRIKYEGKKFRNLAYGRKENHFFGDRGIWESFKTFHFGNMDRIQEDDFDLNSENLHRHLDDRDKKFEEKTKLGRDQSFLDENVDNHYQQLRYRQASEQPEKLLNNAKKALESINRSHDSFRDEKTSEELKKLVDFISELLKESSTEKLIDHAYDILCKINLSDVSGDTTAISKKAKEISSICYQLEKKLRKSR